MSNGSKNFAEMSLLVFPSHTNPTGTLFGGVILERVDICAALTARRAMYALGAFANSIHLVTRHMDSIDFKIPGKVNDLIFFSGEVTDLGTSSITVKVEVVKEDGYGTRISMLTANVVMCCVDKDGKKVPHHLIFDDGKIVVGSLSTP